MATIDMQLGLEKTICMLEPLNFDVTPKHQLSRRRMLFYDKDTSIGHLQIQHCRMHTIRLIYCPILILKVKDRVILDSG